MPVISCPLMRLKVIQLIFQTYFTYLSFIDLNKAEFDLINILQGEKAVNKDGLFHLLVIFLPYYSEVIAYVSQQAGCNLLKTEGTYFWLQKSTFFCIKKLHYSKSIFRKKII